MKGKNIVNRKPSSFPEKLTIFVFMSVILITLCFALDLTLASMTQTVDMNMDNGWLENVEFRVSNAVPKLVFLLCVFGCFYLLYICYRRETWFSAIKKHKEAAMRMLPVALSVIVFLAGWHWVISSQSAPTHDSYIVTNAAVSFAGGDYSALAPSNSYFHKYPYQLGYVLFTEVLIRFFSMFRPMETLISLQIVNAFCVAAAYYGLVQISKITFKSDMATALTAILLLFCIQPLMFSTFLYGNTAGFMFSVYAVWLALLFSEKRRIWQCVASSFCIGIAVLVKWNNLIALVALCIMIALSLLREKKFIWQKLTVNIAFIAAAITLGIGLNSLAIYQYEARSEIKVSDGVPIAAWAAMGMSESYIAPGWYSPQYVSIYEDLGRDKEAVTAVSMEIVKERLSVFREDKGYAAEFFNRKFLSQWNEPTFQSIWTNQVRGQYAEKTGIAEYICGDGEKQAKTYMEYYNFLVFALFTAGLVFALRRRSINDIFLPLIILGAFLYHLIFEAKSQYAIFYFVMMIPTAAYGLREGIMALRKNMTGGDGYSSSVASIVAH